MQFTRCSRWYPRSKVRCFLIKLLQGLRCLGLERRSAREALEHDGADAPEVGLGVVLEGHDHLGRHVHWRPAERGRHHAVLEESREAEVGDLERDVRRRRLGPWPMAEQDVLRLQVSVHDTLGVESPHGAGNLPQEEADGILTQRAFLQEILRQVSPIAVLHDEMNMVGGFLAVEQGDHVFVMQLGQLLENFDFLAEEILRLCQVLLGDALDGHRQLRFRLVAALVDDREGAMADQILGVVLELADSLHGLRLDAFSTRQTRRCKQSAVRGVRLCPTQRALLGLEQHPTLAYPRPIVAAASIAVVQRYDETISSRSSTKKAATRAKRSRL